MKPFEEALIDSILEEYAEILPTQDGGHWSAQNEAAQAQNCTECNAGRSATELERISLWLDRKEKHIYLHPKPGAAQYVFLKQANQDMCLQVLLWNGYTLRK